MQDTVNAMHATFHPRSLHASIKVSCAPLYEAEPDADDERSRTAVRRVMTAYQRAKADFQSPARSLWEYIEGHNAATFLTALDAGDETAVFRHLRAMLRTNLVWGLGCVCADVWNHFRTAPRQGSYQIRFADVLVGLAEAVGAHRLTNPEQQPGVHARALDLDLDQVYRAAEHATGLDLTFPAVAGAFGCTSAGRQVTIDSLSHSYAVARLRELGARPGDSVAEIGGGYGCLAMLAYRAGLTDYTVYDLPWVNALQGYFLIMALPPGSVRLYGEETGKLGVLPGWCFGRIGDRSIDYAVNTNSLPEMGAETARGYLRDIRRGVRKLFLSINQEGKVAVMDYGPQQCVAELVAEMGGFQRLSRSRYWMRHGYVEEVFRPE
jgi:hypothetical protein